MTELYFKTNSNLSNSLSSHRPAQEEADLNQYDRINPEMVEQKMDFEFFLSMFTIEYFDNMVGTE